MNVFIDCCKSGNDAYTPEKFAELLIEREALEVTIRKMKKTVSSSTPSKNEVYVGLVKKLELINSQIETQIKANRAKPKSIWLDSRMVTLLKGSTVTGLISALILSVMSAVYGTDCSGNYGVARVVLVIVTSTVSAASAAGLAKYYRAIADNSKLEISEDNKHLHNMLIISFNEFLKNKNDKSLKKILEVHKLAEDSFFKFGASSSSLEKHSFKDIDQLASGLIETLPEDSEIRRHSLRILSLVIEGQRYESEAKEKMSDENLKYREHHSKLVEKLVSFRRKSLFIRESLGLAENEPSLMENRVKMFKEHWEIIQKNLGLTVLKFEGISISKDGTVETQDVSGKTFTYQFFTEKPPSSISQSPSSRDSVIIDMSRVPIESLSSPVSTPNSFSSAPLRVRFSDEIIPLNSDGMRSSTSSMSSPTNLTLSYTEGISPTVSQRAEEEITLEFGEIPIAPPLYEVSNSVTSSEKEDGFPEFEAIPTAPPL